jgi:flagellar biosynthesis protein FlhB
MGALAEETAVIICAVVAMVSSIGMIVTYYACANWRRELRRIKTLLLILRYDNNYQLTTVVELYERLYVLIIMLVVYFNFWHLWLSLT